MDNFGLAVKDFLNHCDFEKNLSIKTIKAYRTDLQQFAKFLYSRNKFIDIKEISKIDFKNYLEQISSLKPKSRKRKIATLKSMMNYLEFEDKILFNPLRKLRINIKEPKILPRCLSLHEIQWILKFAYTELMDTKPESYCYRILIRNVCIIELLFSTGARVSEIASLKVTDIDFTSGFIRISGKGSKERTIQIFNKDVLHLLSKYKELDKEHIHKNENYFFINRIYRKLSDQSIRRIVKLMAIKAGIKKHITPHVFRHSFATLLLEKEVDIKYIQTLLGHSSITTTQIYIQVNNFKVMESLRIKHPRKDMCFKFNNG